MSGLKIGSLFSGFGGLDMAVEEVFNARTAWVSDIDKGACKILAHRYPDVPNLGDITSIKWTPDCPECGKSLALYWVADDAHRAYWCREHGEFDLSIRTPDVPEPVDIITGGSPCQDLSHAGKRAGMTEGTRSNLWVAMREAIAQLKPSIVIWENVRGAYSAAADSDLESDAGLLGGVRRRDGEPVLRALGRVLGDLSDLGYDASWHGLRAADVGACHGRFRVFVVAHAKGYRWDQGQAESARLIGRLDAAVSGDEAVRLLPSPRTSDANGAGVHGDGGLDLRTVVTLLPTPTTTQRGTDAQAASREGAGPNLHNAVTHLLPTPTATPYGSNQSDSDGAAVRPSLDTLASSGKLRLLPTPKTTDVSHIKTSTRAREMYSSGDLMADVIDSAGGFGQYATAIARWESVIGRPAPSPTEPTGRNGAARLSPRFTEWMMGAPDGWITDVPGITRNEALRACGNGVVKQQAVAALRYLLAIESAA